MRTPLFLVAVASVLVSACSTTPQTRSTYLLRSSSHLESGQVVKVGNDYLGELKVANYIDQSGLVLELSSGVIHSAKHHRWAEPLRVSLRDFLSTEISAGRGESLAKSPPSHSAQSTRIDVIISQFHGDADGNAVLVARWSLSRGKKRKDYQFTETIPLGGTGYGALVAAETQLLVQLSESIVSELK
jgi:uncharacterized lipoprotein YmbA